MEALEAEFSEHPSTVLAVAQNRAAVAWTPSFAVSVDQAIERKREKTRFFREVMEEGKHYGVIPGTGTKPTLLKPGAEMLLANMGLQAEFSNELEPIIDYTGAEHGGESFIRYSRRCTIYRQTGAKEDDRIIIAVAGGSCSSWEEKYRYRNASFVCPDCGKETIKKSKFSDGPLYYCYTKIGGCGAKFAAEVFDGMVLGKIANPNIADVENTILKMADKRALVAATLIATGCSDIFTQDLEDMAKQKPISQTGRAEKPKAPVKPPPPKPAIDDHTEQVRYALRSFLACYPQCPKDEIGKEIMVAIKSNFDLQETPKRWADVQASHLKWAGDYFAKVKAAADAESEAVAA